MNILVLGGNGFLGSKVVQELILNNHKVVCTKRVSSDLSRLENLKKDVMWIPATVESVECATQFCKFDCMINLVCNYGKDEILYNDIIESNLAFPLGVINVLLNSGTKRFITIGTGLPDNLNMYSFSKKKIEDFGSFFVDKHDVHFSSLILEMFYGSDEPIHRFLPSIIRKMIRGEDINTTLGTQLRDVVAVDDVIKAILGVLHNQPIGYAEIPVGTGIAPSIAEIIEFIWKETGEKSKLNIGSIPMRKGEPDCVADTSKISSIISWQPVYWKKGIKKMIDDIQNN